MIENIPEALRSANCYTSLCDDGTNRYADWVEVDGLPGQWPDGPHYAAVARTAQSMLCMARDIPDSSMSSEEKVAMVVKSANDQHRIQNVDEAHQAAHYEDTLRGFLPKTREELIAVHGAMRAYQSLHGAPTNPSYKFGYLPSAQESENDRRAAEERFAAAVGPEIFAEGVHLSRDYGRSRRKFEELCTDFYLRSAEAIRDYREGVDNTQAHQTADYAKYGPLG